MIINITYDASVANAPAGFTTAVADAAEFFETLFSNPITVNLDIGWGEIQGSPLEADALGESLGNQPSPFTYTQLRNALVATDTGSYDTSAVASLPATSPVGSGRFEVDNAEAKALGLLSANAAGVDGYAGFSSSDPFTFNPTDRAVSGDYDFIGVAEHEISEDLGRVDDLDTDGTRHSAFYAPLDLFRYSGNGVRQLTTGSPSYFSADGGATDLGGFNNNNLDPGGDLGDWASSVGDDSFLDESDSGVENPVTPRDLQVMEVLGYQLAANPTVVSGQIFEIAAGETIANLAVAAGGTVLVDSGGVSDGAAVAGSEEIYGSALATTVSNGGQAIVFAGGIAANAAVDGGSLVVSSGAVVSGAIGGGIGGGTVLLPSGDQSLVAGAAGLTVSAGTGNDTVNALVGDDIFETGAGEATVYGAADDTIEAPDGGAFVGFAAGSSAIILAAANGTALLYDGAGDSLTGGAAATTVIGAAGDYFSFGAGADTLNALAGDERAIFSGGDATVFGGVGDTIGSGAGTAIIFDSGSNAIILVSTSGSLLINSGPGDSLTGGAAAAQLIGAAGDDITLGTGADTVNALPIDETIDFGAGDATIYGGVGDTIGSAAGSDVIFDAGNTAIIAVQTGGSDVIYSGGGDTLSGGTAAAQIIGVGNDTITLGSGADTVNALAGNQAIILGSGPGTVYGASGDAFTTGDGADYVDFIAGHAGSESLAPGSGSDTAGNDTIADFNQGQGDRILETGAAATNTLNSAHPSGNSTVLTLSDGATLTLAGISHIDGSFFA